MKKLSLYIFLGLFVFNSAYAEVYYCTDGAVTGFNSKKDKTKWIAKFNSLRNNWAHEASKNNGLSKEEVATLKIMYNHCNKTSYNNVNSA